MDTLTDLAAALAVIPDRELHGLRATLGERFRNVVPSLMGWLEAAADFEINRRAGFTFRLVGPMAAIPDAEVGRSIVARRVLARRACSDGRADRIPLADFLTLTATLVRADYIKNKWG